MRVFVAGAGGALGPPLVRGLVERRHDVVATTRTPAKADRLRALGAEPAVMDGLDARSVGEAVARAEPDVIVHEMTALAGPTDLKHFDDTFAVTNELRTKGTDNLLSAADAVGVGRFVAQSYAGWPNRRNGGPPATEDESLDPDPPSAATKTLAAIEYLERAVTSAPLEGLVLRYGALYGPGASDELVELVRDRKLPLVGDGAGVWSWLHVDDAAAATVVAVEGGPPGIYNIVDDDPAPVAEWLPYLADVLGAPPPRHVPTWVARLVVGENGISLMTRIRGSANAKARRELDWQPRFATWRDGFRDGLGPSERVAA